MGGRGILRCHTGDRVDMLVNLAGELTLMLRSTRDLTDNSQHVTHYAFYILQLLQRGIRILSALLGLITTCSDIPSPRFNSGQHSINAGLDLLCGTLSTSR
ncbi:Uncharacterised protein [Vibrio cholerae]|uniref:Uncharacterized protein n=1 Tax=Vibrio cholerae TaxID=666 RepID=A0A655QWG9_VIBCL|nr:Uncharacterised protein [Vibrio cholerae]CSA72725.1 Uncharacterised protein [Vibrio cholerae]